MSIYKFPVYKGFIIALYLNVMPIKNYANRADPDQAALIRAACSGSTLFPYRNMIRDDPAPVGLTSNLFTLYTKMKWAST